MSQYTILLTTTSDATFSSGDGVAGLLDREVEYDTVTGLPYLRGRTLKGLLGEEADNILFSLEHIGAHPSQGGQVERWLQVRTLLFGETGSDNTVSGLLHFGPARLPDSLRRSVVEAIERQQVSAQDVLASLTAVRRQTANTAEGIPVDGSLRTMRVVLRQTPFQARVVSKRTLFPQEEAFLAATVLALRRAGTGRNRGRGRLQTDLYHNDRSILHVGYQTFIQEAGL